MLVLVLCFMLVKGHAQAHDSFKMLSKADRTLTSIHTFSSTGIIQAFNGSGRISGLSVTGEIELHSDTSLVRIILLDKKYDEYLVYEAYPLLVGTTKFKFLEISEETNSLDDIEPLYIRVEVKDAECTITEFKIAENAKFDKAKKLEVANNQQYYKIEKIREQLKKNKQHWTAGETSISALSYAEKKLLFGGELPNLNGFEYYIGGIFTVNTGPDEISLKSKSLSVSNYVAEFSWRNRHGIDWTTPVKNQGSCQSCWAFSTTGATEILANLYFNQKLDLDLSEQNLVSSVSGSSCNGGYPGDALRYIRSNGIVAEECMPYAAEDMSSGDQCAIPDERINISGIRYFSDKNEETLKSYIINGPVSLGINSWKHTVTLVGYKMLQEGDSIRNQNSEGIWETLLAGDPLIGKTAWVIKNSWGTNWGDGGFAYLVLEMSDISSTYQVYGEVKTLNYSEADISCTDNDDDGYYFWGLGPKPAHCPPCPDLPDSDDSNKCLGPADEFGNSIPTFIYPPVANGALQCETQDAAILTAVGEEIRWYDGGGLIHKGNDFNPGTYAAGMHKFFATQTIDGCESSADTVILKVTTAPNPPVVSDTSLCEGESIQFLSAIGENIRWYNNQTGENESFKGKNLELSIVDPGVYIYYATQEENNCESYPASAFVTVREKPDVSLEDEVISISLDQSIALSSNYSFENYLWNDGDSSPTKFIDGQALGIGLHSYSLEVTDVYGCRNNDSVLVEVSNPSAINISLQTDDLGVYPNPSKGQMTVSTDHVFNSGLVRLYLINLAGQQVWERTLTNSQNHICLSLDLNSLGQGVYMLVLTDNYTSQMKRIVIQ